MNWLDAKTITKPGKTNLHVFECEKNGWGHEVYSQLLMIQKLNHYNDLDTYEYRRVCVL